MKNAQRRRIKITRDLGLYLVGLGGVIWVVVKDNVDRPALLVLLASMIGLPAYLRSDEKRKEQRDDSAGQSRSGS